MPASDSDNTPHPAKRPRKIGWPLAIGGLLIAGIKLLPAAIPDWGYLLAAGLVITVVGVYVLLVLDTHRKRSPASWQLDVEFKELWGVSHRTARRHAHMLVDPSEGPVEVLARRKVLYLLVGLAIPLTFAVACFFIAATRDNLRFTVSSSTVTPSAKTVTTENKKHDHGPLPRGGEPKGVTSPLHPHVNLAPDRVVLPREAVAGIGLFGLLVCGLIFHDWLTVFFMVNRKRGIKYQEPLAIFPWADGYEHPIFLSSVEAVNVEGSVISRLIGLAHMSLSTKMQHEEDKFFKNMRGWPHLDRLKTTIESLASETEPTADDHDQTERLIASNEAVARSQRQAAWRWDHRGLRRRY